MEMGMDQTRFFCRNDNAFNIMISYGYAKVDSGGHAMADFGVIEAVAAGFRLESPPLIFS
jgi:hypothetical protein